MRTLFDHSARLDLCRRAQSLTPDRAAVWGQMTCLQMLAHVNDALRMALGDIPTKFQGLPMQIPGMGYLAIHWLPWGKGMPSAPELFRKDGIDWQEEQRALPELMQRLAAREPGALMPIHPLFGKISHKDWAVLARRHTDHHLKQFGA